MRLVQMDFADESAELRQEQLGEEVKRALSAVVPQEREAFLRGLQEMFPTWDANVEVTPRSAAAATRSSFDERELRNAGFLVERLVEAGAKLSDEEKLGVAARLRTVGIGTEPSGGSWPESAAERLRAKLQIGAAARLDAARTVELAGMLAELAVSLDQVVWNTWKAIAPRAELRRTSELHKPLARFVTGDPDVSRTQVKTELERLRQLTAAIVASVGQAGRQFAQRHVVRFSIESIKEAAGPGTLMKPQAVKCWEKYVELAGAMDAVAVETELLQSISKYAEDLVKGLNR